MMSSRCAACCVGSAFGAGPGACCGGGGGGCAAATILEGVFASAFSPREEKSEKIPPLDSFAGAGGAAVTVLVESVEATCAGSVITSPAARPSAGPGSAGG